jgi:hypothetical protein
MHRGKLVFAPAPRAVPTTRSRSTEPRSGRRGRRPRGRVARLYLSVKRVSPFLAVPINCALMAQKDGSFLVCGAATSGSKTGPRGRLQDHRAGGPFPFSPGTMTMPISLPRSSISPACRQHDLPVMRRVPMLRGCSSSLRQKPPRSVPPSSSAASWRQRSSCADCSLALPTSRRPVSAPEPSPAGSRYPWRRVRSGGGSRVGAGRPDPRPAVSAYSMDKPALKRCARQGASPASRR